jgi:hypothetical protein
VLDAEEQGIRQGLRPGPLGGRKALEMRGFSGAAVVAE